MKNNLKEINSRGVRLRIKTAIWNIRKQKHPIRTAKRKKKTTQNKDSIRSLWDNFKHTNIWCPGKREKETENLFEKK